MNTEYNSPTQGKSFIPLTLISLSIIIFFGSQLKAISQAKENLRINKTKMDDAVAVNVPENNLPIELRSRGKHRRSRFQAVVKKLAHE